MLNGAQKFVECLRVISGGEDVENQDMTGELMINNAVVDNDLFGIDLRVTCRRKVS